MRRLIDCLKQIARALNIGVFQQIDSWQVLFLECLIKF